MSIFSTIRSIRTVTGIACISTILMFTGCSIYRVDVQQGQFSAINDADGLIVGMTQREVLDLMGTPLVADSFNPNRWDYVYNLIPGDGSEKVQEKITLIFGGDDLLSEIIRSSKETDD